MSEPIALNTVSFYAELNNEFIRIVVPRNGTVIIRTSRRTEEGYIRGTDTYTFTGSHVFHVRKFSERDCDGVTDSGGTWRAHTSRLASIESFDDPNIFVPDWQSCNTDEAPYSDIDPFDCNGCAEDR
jgi:hypothetical protein